MAAFNELIRGFLDEDRCALPALVVSREDGTGPVKVVTIGSPARWFDSMAQARTWLDARRESLMMAATDNPTITAMIERRRALLRLDLDLDLDPTSEADSD